MKAKNRLRSVRNRLRHEEPLPHELGLHLFAMIKRNLLSRRRPENAPAPSQLTFAF
jgi:hypothetical protein